MIHIRTDNEIENTKRQFACGLGPELPAGDKYFGWSEIGAHHYVDCPGCRPHRTELGTPISQLSGQPGKPGYERFRAIAKSWGYD